MNHIPNKKFDCVLFNGVIQFIPNTSEALRLAISNLNSNGRVVISHANGASFVRNERKGNPATVINTMPEISYLESFCSKVAARLIRLDEIVNYEIDEHQKLERLSSYDDFYLAIIQK